MSWTKAEFDKLIELDAKGFTGAEIAQELGRSRNSVIGKLHRARKNGGVDSPRKGYGRSFSKEDDLEIQRLWNEEGLSAIQIAKHFDKTDKSITSRVARLRRAGMFFKSKPKYAPRRKSFGMPKRVRSETPKPVKLRPNPIMKGVPIGSPGCKFIFTDLPPEEAHNHLYCGNTCLDGVDYCPAHWERMTTTTRGHKVQEYKTVTVLLEKAA